MTCPKCGMENDEDAFFCKRCGFPLDEEVENYNQNNNSRTKPKRGKTKTKNKSKVKTKVKYKDNNEKQKGKMSFFQSFMMFFFILLSICALGAAGFLGYYIYQNSNIEVPDVIGYSYEDAERTLKEAINKLNTVISKYNSCTGVITNDKHSDLASVDASSTADSSWDNDMQFNPTVDFVYNQDYMKKMSKIVITSVCGAAAGAGISLAQRKECVPGNQTPPNNAHS